MKARVAVYDKTGKSFQGYLPVIDLKFSEEVGGSGTCTFEALYADMEEFDAWDSVIKIQLERAPGTWINGPAYVSRHVYNGHKGGSQRFPVVCRGLLEAWADETVLLPEYVVNTMPRGAGIERGIGWMSSSYNASSDPYEAWDGCNNDPRSSRPEDWPTGSGAVWMTSWGSGSTSESKYFRSKITITGTSPRLVEFYLSADESADLWVAGERIITTNSVETGYKEFEKARMRLYPGTYVVGIHNVTKYTKGGTGTDPVIAAGAILDADGNVSSWIMATDAATWIATRRDDEPPNDVPPGPNPGQVLTYLYLEAKERKATGWPGVTFGFDSVHDSYGAAWGNHDIIERIFRYGQDTYWTMFQAWAESGEVDVWMGADLVLHAALRQGEHRSLTLTTEHLNTFSATTTEGHGNWVIAQGHGGWVYAGSHTPRREFALEIGEAYSNPVARKIALAALKDGWRWDASGSLNPPQAGWIPYYNIKLGDDMHVTYKGIDRDVSITSFSAVAGEGGLLWDVEFTEYPPDSEVPPPSSMLSLRAAPESASVAAPSTTEEPGLFDGLEEYVPAPPPTSA